MTDGRTRRLVVHFLKQCVDGPAPQFVVRQHDGRQRRMRVARDFLIVVLPNYELGRWAVDTLLQEVHNQAAGAPVRHRMVKLDGPLIERGSVREITEAKRAAINIISD